LNNLRTHSSAKTPRLISELGLFTLACASHRSGGMTGLVAKTRKAGLQLPRRKQVVVYNRKELWHQSFCKRFQQHRSELAPRASKALSGEPQNEF